MNLVFEKSSARLYQQLGLGMVALLAVFALVAEVRSQDKAQNGSLLLPPKSNLVALHWPDLTKLEADVREQLVSLQNSLAVAVNDPATPEAMLSEAYGTMGETYQAYSLVASARECYLNATRLAPQDFRWVYLLGKLWQEEGNVDDAIAQYKIASHLRPEYSAVPVNLGNIYLQLDRLDDARASFKAALEINENLAAAHYGLGQVSLSNRDYAEAVKHFDKALVQAPEAKRIHYSLAMAYRGLGDAEQARAHLAQQGPVGVRATDPIVDGLRQLIKGERLHLIRGRLALEARQYAEAAVEFRRAIAARPDSLAAHINLGAVLTQTGDLQGAIALFEETLRLDPENTIGHYNLAALLANENKHEQAIVHLQSVLSVDPNDVSARFLLAQEMLKSGRLEEALAEFSRVVQVDLNNEDALLEQVKLLQRKRQYKQALESLEKGHAQYPQKGRTAVMLASLLAASPQYDLRDGARALKLAQLVYKANGSLQHGALVAMALAELGRCSEAAEWQQRMIATAAEERKTDLLAKLRTDLKLYKGAQSCRPVGETPAEDRTPDPRLQPVEILRNPKSPQLVGSGLAALLTSGSQVRPARLTINFNDLRLAMRPAAFCL